MSPSPWSFSFEPVFLVFVVAAAALYVRRARTERPRPLRVAAFVIGLLLIAVPLNSPLETLAAHYLLLIHLLQNAMIADWAPALILLGLTPGMRRAIAARGGRLFKFATEPVVALSLWTAGWYGVHVPAFYDWALRTGWPLNLEHAILIAAGFVFWWPLLEAEPKRLTTGGTLAYLGVAFLTSPWLSLAYVFSTRPFYDFYAEAPRLSGLSPTKDQNFGGILMNAELTAVFFFVLVWYVVRLLNEEERLQRQRDELAVERISPSAIEPTRRERP